MNAKASSAVRAGWDLFPGLAAAPCHFALCCCEALSRTSVASLVLCWLCPACLSNSLLSLLRGWGCRSSASRSS